MFWLTSQLCYPSHLTKILTFIIQFFSVVYSFVYLEDFFIYNYCVNKNTKKILQIKHNIIYTREKLGVTNEFKPWWPLLLQTAKFSDKQVMKRTKEIPNPRNSWNQGLQFQDICFSQLCVTRSSFFLPVLD